MANILITGGAGFIGSHLTTRFVELGHDVRVLDDFSTGHRENLAHVADKIDLHERDLRSLNACMNACEGIDYVFHEGAIPSVPKSVDDPQANSMMEIVPAQVAFNDQGMLESVKYGVKNPNMTVVKSVSGPNLNEFIVSRINR